MNDPFKAPEWRISQAAVPYPEAMAEMDSRVAAILEGRALDLIWLLEHPPLYTAGTGADEGELIDAGRFPVFDVGRGGKHTYHGPGQRVIYAMMDLRRQDQDLRAHMHRLEEWIIRTLAEFGVQGERREGRVGVWVIPGAVGCAGASASASQSRRSEEEAAVGCAGASASASQSRPDILVEKKIAALGVRCRKWVTSHGLALNVSPNLSHFEGIVPCGLPGFGVTSLHDLGVRVSMADVDAAFQRHFAEVFPFYGGAK